MGGRCAILPTDFRPRCAPCFVRELCMTPPAVSRRPRRQLELPRWAAALEECLPSSALDKRWGVPPETTLPKTPSFTIVLYVRSEAAQLSIDRAAGA